MPTDGQVLTWNSGNAGTPADPNGEWAAAPATVSADYFKHRASGGGWTCYYTANMSCNATPGSSASCNANTMYGIPFMIPLGGVIDDIRMYVIGAGAGNCRVGIYTATSDTNLYPGALVSDCGTFAVNAGGVKNIGGLSVTIVAGKLHWFALNQDASWTCQGFAGADSTTILGYDNTAASQGYNSCSVALAYAAMPAAFTAAGALVTGNVRGVWYHLSS